MTSSHISWLKTHYCQWDFFFKPWWHLSTWQEHQMGLGNLVSLIYCSLSSTHHKCQRWVPHAWHLPRGKGCTKSEPLHLHESVRVGGGLETDNCEGGCGGPWKGDQLRPPCLSCSFWNSQFCPKNMAGLRCLSFRCFHLNCPPLFLPIQHMS